MTIKVRTSRNFAQDEARFTLTNPNEPDTTFLLYRLDGTDHIRITWASDAAIKGYVDTKVYAPERYGNPYGPWKQYAQAFADAWQAENDKQQVS